MCMYTSGMQLGFNPPPLPLSYCTKNITHSISNMSPHALVTLGREGSPSSDVRPTLIADSVASEVKSSLRPTSLLSRTLSKTSSSIWDKRRVYIVLPPGSLLARNHWERTHTEKEKQVESSKVIHYNACKGVSQGTRLTRMYNCQFVGLENTLTHNRTTPYLYIHV